MTGDDFKDHRVVLDITDGSGDFDDAEGTAEIEPRHGHDDGHGHSAAHAEGHGGHGGDHGGHAFEVTFHFE